MKTYGICLCLAVFALWAALPSASGQNNKWKPGICPRDNTNCTHKKKPDHCTTDADCKGQMKCCFIECAKHCRHSMKAKSGFCPLDATICRPGRPVLCHSDHECPGAKKCCSYECVVQCKDPR